MSITAIDSNIRIAAGSIVTLKCGGPSMIVTERSVDKVHVLWHEMDGALHEIWMPVMAVKAERL